jgi:hypothetical protein
MKATMKDLESCIVHLARLVGCGVATNDSAAQALANNWGVPIVQDGERKDPGIGIYRAYGGCRIEWTNGDKWAGSRFSPKKECLALIKASINAIHETKRARARREER